MKITIAQINPVVGDIEGNSAAIAEAIGAARGRGSGLVLLPELAVTGYPPRDLLERGSFAARSREAVRRLAGLCTGGVAAVVGFVEPNEKEAGKPLHNSAALLAEGKVQAVYRKMLLPSYDVFDETRWFEPGEAPCVFTLGGLRLGITICEDMWSEASCEGKPLYRADPAALAVREGAKVLINISASPFTLEKRSERRRVCAEAARRHGAAVLYCNQVGGNDDILFDGGSFAVDPSGAIAACAREFETDFLEVEVGADAAPKGRIETPAGGREAVLRRALRLGIADYARKCRRERVWIGLSGGIDSAVVACLASEALGPQGVHCVAMPSRFSSDASFEDAAALACALGIGLVKLSIEPMYASFLEALGPHFGGRSFDVAEENLQARVRGVLLMALSNKLGGLVLATGNKSEIATGYCTLYGDMVGALAPIGDVLKTDVYALADRINGEREVIPRRTIERPPTAELRPGQTDQDTLPPYALLDRVLRLYLEEGLDLDAITARGIDRALVLKILGMLRRAEFKRKQSAIVLKVSSRAFGSGRRYPIAQGYEEEKAENSKQKTE